MNEYKLTFYMIGGAVITCTVTTDQTKTDYATELARTDRRIVNDDQNRKTTIVNMQNCNAVEIAEV